MSKLDVLHVSEWVPWRFDGSYQLQQTKEPARLVVGPVSAHADIFLSLARALRPPFAFLYILHTPRQAPAGGRFQSPALGLAEVEAFLGQFGPFLAADSRHDLWLRSRPDSATLVWDRHDLLYAYGPLERFEDILAAKGLKPGTPSVPTPHAHNYHEAWDAQEVSILAAFNWAVSDLQEQDRQA